MSARGEFVLYWMQAYRRLEFNPALADAQRRASELKIPLLVLEVLAPQVALPFERQLVFALEGALETAKDAASKAITYRVALDPQAVLKVARRAALVVTDEYPCGGIPEATELLRKRLPEVEVLAIDGNGVVPMSRFPKEEFAARTLRPKLHRLLPEFLEVSPVRSWRASELDGKVLSVLDRDLGLVAGSELASREQELRQIWGRGKLGRIGASPLFKGGRSEAKKRLKGFLRNKLNEYAESRNDPMGEATSGLSPYLRYGYISALEIAQAVPDFADPTRNGAQAFLEELIVRRELSFNYVRSNSKYASFEGLPQWARKTLLKHARDRRPHVYELRDFERAQTSDPLWNAAQRELVTRGKIHGYVRMYWGKMLLEWSADPRESFAWALDLNNRYALDGFDPNSYAGVAWCWGKHDRPWGPERKIFGLVRCMTGAGMRRKFDVDGYIRSQA